MVNDMLEVHAASVAAEPFLGKGLVHSAPATAPRRCAPAKMPAIPARGAAVARPRRACAEHTMAAVQRAYVQTPLPDVRGVPLRSGHGAVAKILPVTEKTGRRCHRVQPGSIVLLSMATY